MGLILAGLAGAAFFLLTDPRVGWLGSSRNVSENVIDAIRNGSTATWVGLIGSAVVAVIGLWLMSRRSN